MNNDTLRENKENDVFFFVINLELLVNYYGGVFVYLVKQKLQESHSHEYDRNGTHVFTRKISASAQESRYHIQLVWLLHSHELVLDDFLQNLQPVDDTGIH